LNVFWSSLPRIITYKRNTHTHTNTHTYTQSNCGPNAKLVSLLSILTKTR